GTLEIAAYIVIPLAATLLLNWQNAKAFNVRYVIVGLPAFVAILAAGAGSLRGTRRVISGALLATCAVSLANHYFNPRFAKDDVKRSLAEVERRMEPGDCIFAPTVWHVVQHYATGNAPLHFVYGDAPDLAARQLDAMMRECGTFWYLRARPWVDDPAGRVLDEIERRCTPLDRFAFPGVEVTRYSVNPETAPR
ncbi:MAG TPA: hypothetical protein VFT13_04380, partial [Candidatus Krumholzibacteria bacterium]|nr:hypothetical protein [Candidatus Krumholzibacteria bacterium]